MKISTKGRYGMHMMCYLANNPGETPIALTTMAEELNLPEAYLEQLMRKLKKNNFVESVRGAHGGYFLSMPASEIKILDLLDCLEDGTATAPCSDNTDCNHTADCANRFLWRKIDLAINEALEAYTLQDLLNEHNLDHELAGK